MRDNDNGWLQDDVNFINKNRKIGSHRKPRDNSVVRGLSVMAVTAAAVAFLSTTVVTGGTPVTTRHPTPLSVAPSLPYGPPVDVDTTQEESDLRLAERASRQHESRDETHPKPQPSTNAERVIAYAVAQIGKAYRFGTKGPETFDCSGLVVAAFNSIGIGLYHFTGRIVREGNAVARSELARGDIVFPTPNHVGIYIGNNQMVHASSSRGRVVIGSVYSFYAARRI